VEQDARAIGAIRENVSRLGADDKVELLARSADQLPFRQPFDLIFADPPYAPGSGSTVIAELLRAGWASAGSWMAIETQRADAVDGTGCSVEAERDIGRARITLLRA
jgi:16S rRNA (guanine966-N2)-methyltransferase